MILNPQCEIFGGGYYKLDNPSFSQAGNGNVQIDNLSLSNYGKGVPFALIPTASNTSGIITFFSSTNRWYVHCANFQTGQYINDPDFTGCTILYLKQHE